MKPATGMIRYNEQDGTLQYYDGTIWLTPFWLPNVEPPKNDLFEDYDRAMKIIKG